MCESFPKSRRLLKRRDFRRIMRYGKETRGKGLIIHRRSSRSGGVKIGITVSKKFGKAHKRNRFKRLVREVFRLHCGSFPDGLRLHVRPNLKGELSLSFALIQEELLALLR